MSIEVAVRDAEESDIEAIEDVTLAAHEPCFAYLRQQMGEEIYSALHPDWRVEISQETKEMCGPDARMTVRVAEVENRVTGFVTFRSDYASRIGEIVNSAVRPRRQEAAIRTRLYLDALDRLAKSGMRYAKVRVGDDPAHATERGAYEQVGFAHQILGVWYYCRLGDQVNETENPPGVAIRPVRPADLQAIAHIAQESWAPIYAHYRQALGEELFALEYGDWRMQKAAHVTLHCDPRNGALACVAETSGAVLGFASFRPSIAPQLGEIGSNAVHPDAQGLGIGSALYRRAFDSLLRLGMRFAKVGTGRYPAAAPARRAYKRVGFSIAIPSVRYYRQL